MKIIITETQLYNLVPPAVRRRITDKDLKKIDSILQNNIPYYQGSNVDEFIDQAITDTMHEFVSEYKLDDEVNYDLDDWGDKESSVFNLWWQLIPFLKKRYYGELAIYYQNKKDGMDNL
jgi:hypothetical protein